jgi:16S rRNA (guanine1207-N2)-methyltransferase
MTFSYAVYGHIPAGLADVPAGARQYSPLMPGAADWADIAPASCAGVIVHAPASTLERHAVIARAVKALAPGAPLTVMAANDKGGTRLADDLTGFGCTIEAHSKRHHRIITTMCPAHPTGLDVAIAAGEPRLLPELGMWSQPGLFNWDRIDPGSQVLLDHLPQLKGRGADLGCGFGVLARAVMAQGQCLQMTLIDLDRRALAMAKLNLPSLGVTALWADVRTSKALPTALDFVVMNPPFHDGGIEDRALGVTFIQKAATMLRPGGVLWMTANRHLPYEAVLAPLFQTVEQITQAKGFKIYSAQKAPFSAKAGKSPADKAFGSKAEFTQFAAKLDKGTVRKPKGRT